MESLNKSIEIVEQNQWNRLTNPMESLDESNGFVYKNWRFYWLKQTD